MHKRFGELQVLNGVVADVEPGEVMCIIGPSGSGKTTLLRCINQLETIEPARSDVDGELIGYRERGEPLYELRETRDLPQRSEIGMVFQRFNLFPHMTALENIIEAPMRVKRRRRAAARERAHDAAGSASGSRDKLRCLSAPALRRPAAARGDRPGAGDGARS